MNEKNISVGSDSITLESGDRSLTFAKDSFAMGFNFKGLKVELKVYEKKNEIGQLVELGASLSVTESLEGVYLLEPVEIGSSSISGELKWEDFSLGFEYDTENMGLNAVIFDNLLPKSFNNWGQSKIKSVSI